MFDYGFHCSILVEKKSAWYLVVDVLVLSLEVVKLEVLFQSIMQLMARFRHKDIDILLFEAPPKSLDVHIV